MVTGDLVTYALSKIKVPNSIKMGVILSVIVFEGFRVEERVMRWVGKPRKNYKPYNDTRNTS